MARPKLGESETERLHVKITKEELEAIDDWRYRNRVPSRSEAVRRLCKIGKFSHEEFEQIVEMSSEAVEGITDQMYGAAEIARAFYRGGMDDYLFTIDEVRDLLTVANARSMIASEAIEGLHNLIVSVYNAMLPYANAESIAKGDEEALQRIAEANEAVERAEQKRAEQKENRYISIWMSQQTPEQEEEFEALPMDKREEFISQRIAELQAEHEADAEGFDERYAPTYFWEHEDWREAIERRTKEIRGRK